MKAIDKLNEAELDRLRLWELKGKKLALESIANSIQLQINLIKAEIIQLEEKYL